MKRYIIKRIRFLKLRKTKKFRYINLEYGQ